MSFRQLAKKIGKSTTGVIYIIRRKKYASLETAVKIEIATRGKYKVEDLVRPEVAEALKTFLKLRCPMLQNLLQHEESQSVEKEEETTVEVEK